MSAPSPPHVSRGRGTGRGKELTSSERVAQWVSQRDEKRHAKERWANISSSCNGQESENFAKPSTESDSSSERSKVKRQGAQLYVPPSLRDKKSNTNNVSLSVPANCTNSQTDICQQDENVLAGASVETGNPEIRDPAAIDSDQETDRSKGRGRGRKKPEVAIYIPRALRTIKHDNKTEENESAEDITTEDQRNDVAVDNLLSDATETDVPAAEINIQKESLGEVLLESNPCLQPHATVEELLKPIEDALYQQSKTAFSNETCSGSTTIDLASPVGNDGGQQLQVECSETTTPTHVFPAGEENNSSVEIDQLTSGIGKAVDSFTFEFYDPAVIAFLPSPPIQNQTHNHLMFTGHPAVSEIVHDLVTQQVSAGDIEITSNSQTTSSSYTNDCDMVSEQTASTLEMVTNCDNSNDATHSHVADDNASNSNPIPHTALDLETSEKANTKKPKSKKKSKESTSTKELKSKKEKKEGDAKKMKKKEGDAKKMKKKATPVGNDKATNEENCTSSEVGSQVDSGEVEDSWDALFDDNGDCLDESMIKELTEYVGQVEIDKPKINYLKYEPKELPLNTEAFNHIIEIYDFPPEIATCDLIAAFRDFASRGFDVKWVDDTHALGVFSSTVAANEALRMYHPLLKVRSMSEASKKGQQKARHCQEFLQPYKARPETTSIAARRLVAGALGMAPKVSREVRDQERQKLKEAKEKRRQERQQKSDAWDGSVGRCAMDEDEQSLR